MSEPEPVPPEAQCPRCKRIFPNRLHVSHNVEGIIVCAQCAHEFTLMVRFHDQLMRGKSPEEAASGLRQQRNPGCLGVLILILSLLIYALF